jgi:hypothetical protein
MKVEENEEPVTKKMKILMATKSFLKGNTSFSTAVAAAVGSGVSGSGASSAATTAAGAEGSSVGTLAAASVTSSAAAAATVSAKMISMASLLEDKLQCSICCEVIYQASTTIPCMHSYCGGCLSSWLHTSSTSGTSRNLSELWERLRSVGKQAKCPLCNHQIEQIHRNHILNEMISDLIQMKPELERSESEKKEMERRNTIVYGMALRGTRGGAQGGTGARIRGGAGRGDGQDESEDDEEDDHVPPPPAIAPRGLFHRQASLASSPVPPAPAAPPVPPAPAPAAPPVPPAPAAPPVPPAPAPAAPPVRVSRVSVAMTAAIQNDIESFRRITKTNRSEAKRYVIGAAQRGLVPCLDNALSYFFEQQT